MYLLLLGSNLGNKKQNLLDGIDAIKKDIGNVVKTSSVYETEPWGLTDQPSFLNLALEVDTGLTPSELMKKCKQIELSAGEKPKVQWGPRHLDIDILYHEDNTFKDDHLVIPHPRIAERNFVLIPLMEIAGDFTDPVTHLTIEEMYDQCEDQSEVFQYEE